jgi:NADPH:quinone reductase-like Zn-dependent oxidoreductase
MVGVTALQALDKAKITVGRSVFINGVLGGVGRVAAQLALMRRAAVGGSCRDTAAARATALGIYPVVGFGFNPTPLAREFDLVFDTAGTLTSKTARTLLRPGGHVVDIIPTPPSS